MTSPAASTARPDILDRNGNILARDLATFSVYAEPRRIVDADEAVEKLLTAMPDLNARSLYQRLSGKSGFTWIKRSISPAKQQEILNLGIPGIGFREEVIEQLPREVLAEAIEAGGSSLRDHRQASGELGYFQHSFRVYGREGQPCPRPGCAGTVRRIVQGGRSTWYCPVCQR